MKLNLNLSQASSLNIKPVFTYYLPKDDKETISNITSAINSGILSHESGVELNPLIDDSDNEKERIKQEVAEKQAREDKIASQNQPPTI